MEVEWEERGVLDEPDEPWRLSRVFTDRFIGISETKMLFLESCCSRNLFSFSMCVCVGVLFLPPVLWRTCSDRELDVLQMVRNVTCNPAALKWFLMMLMSSLFWAIRFAKSLRNKKTNVVCLFSFTHNVHESIGTHTHTFNFTNTLFTSFASR